jgi:hypothetical protein
MPTLKLTDAQVEALLRACRNAESLIESDPACAPEHGWTHGRQRALTNAEALLLETAIRRVKARAGGSR